MILRKTYVIKKWKTCDDEINSAVNLFKTIFAMYPNILLANHATFSRFDIIADKENIHHENGAKPDKYQHVGIGSFVANEYELNFCFDEKLPDKYFSLIYDSDTSDDGEPVPEEDTMAGDVTADVKIKAA